MLFTFLNFKSIFVHFCLGQCDSSHKNSTKRCTWHAAECGKYIVFIIVTYACLCVFSLVYYSVATLLHYYSCDLYILCICDRELWTKNLDQSSNIAAMSHS